MTFRDQNILMQVGSESAQVDGKTHKLKVAPQLIEGEIVVPLRFIANQRSWSLVSLIRTSWALRLELSQRPAPRLTSLIAMLSEEPIVEAGIPSDDSVTVVIQPDESE
jgi:hypothetical protein